MQHECVDCDGEEGGGGADYLVEGDSDEIAAQEEGEKSVGEREISGRISIYQIDISRQGHHTHRETLLMAILIVYSPEKSRIVRFSESESLVNSNDPRR